MHDPLNFIVMKKRAILSFFILSISSQFMFSQVSIDSLKSNYIYPSFYSYFSAEESWEIHKEAYRKQLEAKGLLTKEIEKKLLEYEEQKEELAKKIKQQRQQAEEQRKKADELRQLATMQRQEAEGQRKQAITLRQKAEEQRRLADQLRHEAEKRADAQRQEAEKLRKQANELRQLATLQRQEAEKQREQANTLIQKAEEQRKLAAQLRQQAEKRANAQRQQAEELRKQADELRKVAEMQREEAEILRNSFVQLYGKTFTISKDESASETVTIKVTKKNTLFFSINGKINEGYTLIEIFDPSGKKEGELLLEGSKLSGSTSGTLNKTIADAKTGEWLLKISSIDADGRIHVSVTQYKEPSGNE